MQLHRQGSVFGVKVRGQKQFLVPKILQKRCIVVRFCRVLPVRKINFYCAKLCTVITVIYGLFAAILIQLKMRQRKIFGRKKGLLMNCECLNVIIHFHYIKARYCTYPFSRNRYSFFIMC